jgi:hypothetical protein
MWDWIKSIIWPRGGVGGIRIFKFLTPRLFKTKDKGDK